MKKKSKLSKKLIKMLEEYYCYDTAVSKRCARLIGLQETWVGS